MRPTFLDNLVQDVVAAAEILYKERYYEHIDCLYNMIGQLKHYQRLTESMLNGIHGARSFEDNEKEVERARAADDFHRFDDD